MEPLDNENVVEDDRRKQKTTGDDDHKPVTIPVGTNVNIEEPKKRLKSVVWNHFKQVYVDGVRRYAECNYCSKKLTGRANDGTTHLKDHFTSCPRRVTRDIRQHILIQDQNTSDGKAALSKYSFKRDDLAKMITVHDYPLAMVEHCYFRKYSEGLQPLFKVPCRRTTKNDIMKIYEKQRGYTLWCLEEIESRIAITSDMWTASNQMKGVYKWSLQNRIISFIHVPSPHTAEALAQSMMECLLDWNIDNKLSTLTVDNCSTNDAIIDKLLGTLSSSSLMLKGKIFHMRCCAHIINIIVQEGFSIIKGAIGNVRDSVAFWTGSPKRVQEFKLCARQLNVKCEKELVLACKTRWNSIYIMLNVALEYKDVFNRLSKKERSYVCLPSEDQWKMASIVCEKLKVFYRMTEKFSATLYPTSNIFFPLVCEIKVSLLSWKNSLHDVIRNMTSSMLFKFNKYWSVIHEVMNPRYKLKLINFFFPKIYGDEAKREVTRIRNLCVELFEHYKKKYVENQGTSWKGQSTASAVAIDDSTSNKPTWEMDFESMMCDDDVLETSELDDYLAEKLLPNEEGFDILMWWRCNGSKFPILQKIRRFSQPISSVASESAFSMCGNKLTKQRSRLHPKTVAALMCTQNWLRKEIQDKKHGEHKGFDETVAYDEDVDMLSFCDVYMKIQLLDMFWYKKSPFPRWRSPFPIGDGDGDVSKFPDGDGDGMGMKMRDRGRGRRYRSPPQTRPIPMPRLGCAIAPVGCQRLDPTTRAAWPEFGILGCLLGLTRARKGFRF
ncbi:LOW QUALITY PROTEIN: hypothetical protein OSB04_012319 [Centaurea solstitialis]|uniref:BED-type domain-containing protein n=1 Tax=Centaurea solstitialis TaxID=347529 RepID=A0AA38WMB8_9ASTR|nr:LOW QUALITY PROTEIN: hypothetical protein OSB04_012319 [Centaurea solstitialis]